MVSLILILLGKDAFVFKYDVIIRSPMSLKSFSILDFCSLNSVTITSVLFSTVFLCFTALLAIFMYGRRSLFFAFTGENLTGWTSSFTMDKLVAQSWCLHVESWCSTDQLNQFTSIYRQYKRWKKSLSSLSFTSATFCWMRCFRLLTALSKVSMKSIALHPSW